MKYSTLLAIGLFVTGWIIFSQDNTYLASIIKSEIGESVSIDSISFSWLKTKVSDLIIANPPKSYLKNAISVEEIVIETPSYNFLKPNVDIDKVSLDNIHVFVEFYSMNQNDTNWTILLKKLNEPKTWHKHVKKSVKIQECVLKNVSVTIKGKNLEVKNLPPIKEIILKDLQTENGFLIDRLLRIITNHILANVSTIYKLGGIQGIVLAGPKAAVNTITLPFGWMFKKNNQPKPPMKSKN